MSVCKDLSYLCILHVHFCMCRADDELSLDVVCLFMYVEMVVVNMEGREEGVEGVESLALSLNSFLLSFIFCFVWYLVFFLLFLGGFFSLYMF